MQQCIMICDAASSRDMGRSAGLTARCLMRVARSKEVAKHRHGCLSSVACTLATFARQLGRWCAMYPPSTKGYPSDIAPLEQSILTAALPCRSYAALRVAGHQVISLVHGNCAKETAPRT